MNKLLLFSTAGLASAATPPSFPTEWNADSASKLILWQGGTHNADGSACCSKTAPQCKVPMHDFVRLDYDFAVRGCDGVWAAPLWLTPDTWQWGAGSGEIDSLEFCGARAPASIAASSGPCPPPPCYE